MMEYNELYGYDSSEVSDSRIFVLRQATRDFIETTESTMRYLRSCSRMIDRLAVHIPYLMFISKIEKHQQASIVQGQNAKHQRSVAQALIDFSNRILPRKITDECFGDLLEQLEDMAESMPAWRLRLHILNTIALAVLFTLRQKVKTVFRRDSTHG